jgi:hypothetical protein
LVVHKILTSFDVSNEDRSPLPPIGSFLVVSWVGIASKSDHSWRCVQVAKYQVRFWCICFT